MLPRDGERGELGIERMSGRPLVQQALGAQEEGLVHGGAFRLGVLKAR